MTKLHTMLAIAGGIALASTAKRPLHPIYTNSTNAPKIYLPAGTITEEQYQMRLEQQFRDAGIDTE